MASLWATDEITLGYADDQAEGEMAMLSNPGTGLSAREQEWAAIYGNGLLSLLRT